LPRRTLHCTWRCRPSAGHTLCTRCRNVRSRCRRRMRHCIRACLSDSYTSPWCTNRPPGSRRTYSRRRWQCTCRCKPSFPHCTRRRVRRKYGRSCNRRSRSNRKREYNHRRILADRRHSSLPVRPRRHPTRPRRHPARPRRHPARPRRHPARPRRHPARPLKFHRSLRACPRCRCCRPGLSQPYRRNRLRRPDRTGGSSCTAASPG
jgi:hypothetical protein